jgi:hypothetical protein
MEKIRCDATLLYRIMESSIFANFKTNTLNSLGFFQSFRIQNIFLQICHFLLKFHYFDNLKINVVKLLTSNSYQISKKEFEFSTFEGTSSKKDKRY